MNLCLHVVFGVVLFTAIGMTSFTMADGGEEEEEVNCLALAGQCRQPMSEYNPENGYDQDHACQLMEEEAECLDNLPQECASDDIVQSIIRVSDSDKEVLCGPDEEDENNNKNNNNNNNNSNNRRRNNNRRNNRNRNRNRNRNNRNRNGNNRNRKN